MADASANQRHSIELNKVPVEWDLAAGNLHFFGLPAALFWVNPSLQRMLQPLVAEVGPALFRLLVASQSSLGTEEDYHSMVNVLGSSFEQGFLAWGQAVAVAGWGSFELPEYDHAARHARVVINNPWELQMQSDLAEPWGCPFLQGKIIGIFSHAFGVNCWADERILTDATGAQHVEFTVYPSERTIDAELAELRRAHRFEQDAQREAEIERKTLELQASEENQRAILSSINDLVFTIDKNGYFTRFNVPVGQGELYGHPERFIGHYFRDVLDEDVAEPLGKALNELIADGINHTFDHQMIRQGEPRWFSTNLSIMRDRNQEYAGVVAVVRDITKRQQAELQRHQAEAERLRIQQQMIELQAAMLAELSTPLIPLNDDVVLMPVIGSLDSQRTNQIIDTLLDGVAKHRARVAILDITGLPIVDTGVANAILQAAQAVRLLGTEIVLTGIRPEVAQTLVGLGVDMASIVTRSTLQSGIAYAMR